LKSRIVRHPFRSPKASHATDNGKKEKLEKKPRLPIASIGDFNLKRNGAPGCNILNV